MTEDPIEIKKRRDHFVEAVEQSLRQFDFPSHFEIAWTGDMDDPHDHVGAQMMGQLITALVSNAASPLPERKRVTLESSLREMCERCGWGFEENLLLSRWVICSRYVRQECLLCRGKGLRNLVSSIVSDIVDLSWVAVRCSQCDGKGFRMQINPTGICWLDDNPNRWAWLQGRGLK